MRLIREFLSGVLVLSSMDANAAIDELSGTWKFSKSAIYFSKTGIPPAAAYRTLQIVDGQVLLQPMCSIPTKYSKEAYDYSDFFQMALQGGTEEKDMAKYVQKNFGFDLIKAKEFYVGRKLTQHCSIGLNNIFAMKDRLIFAGPGGSFNSFERSSGGVPTTSDPTVNLYGRKLSHLPFRSDVFNVLCAEMLPFIKGVRQSTDKCGPVYFPYVATKADTDPLARLIGAHTYKKSGSDAQKDYDNPVAHNLHPVYMLLPPLKDVIVAAVEDLEIGDTRPGMAGVFLSIKDGKVVDQITASCTLGEDHGCVDGDGKKTYQLRDSGKFEKITK
jgi:hypothetical protein